MAIAARTRVVLLDYHGVLTDLGLEAVSTPPHIRFIGAERLSALRSLSLYSITIISNQVGVAFGHYTEPDLAAAIEQLIADLHLFCIPLSGFSYCPHHPLSASPLYLTPCNCRKPNPRLVHQAIEYAGGNITDSILIGDTLETDIFSAVEAGIASIWIQPSPPICMPALKGLIATTVSLTTAVSLIHQYFSPSTAKQYKGYRRPAD